MMGKRRGFSLLLLLAVLVGSPRLVQASPSVTSILQEAEQLNTKATYQDQVLQLKALYLQNKAIVQLLDQLLQEQKKIRALLQAEQKVSP